MAKLNAGTVALLSLCMGLVFFAGLPAGVHGRGDGGGGKKDAVADTVKKVVGKAIEDNPGLGPALIRLIFHDCWVNVRSTINDL
jgi:peroxidase